MKDEIALKFRQEYQAKIAERRAAIQKIENEVATKQAQIEKLRAPIAKLEAEVAHFEQQLGRFDQAFGTTPKRPGPKPKAAAAKPAKQGKNAKPVAKAKATAKATKKAVTKTAKRQSNNRAAEGRRAVAQGKRPKNHEAMSIVMGGEVMNASQVYEKLKEKGWLPNANDPRQYISYLLSSNKDHFERVASKGRGFYRVKGAVTNGTSKKVETNNVTTTSSDVDEVLKDAGVIAN